MDAYLAGGSVRRDARRGGEHLFVPELPTFVCFSFLPRTNPPIAICFDLSVASKGRHHYPRQPLNEASKEIHSSFIIASHDIVRSAKVSM